MPSCYARNHIGDKKIQNRGNEEAEIIEVKDANHITVKFKDGTIVKDRKYEDFIHGAMSLRIKYKLNNTKSKWHIIEKATVIK